MDQDNHDRGDKDEFHSEQPKHSSRFEAARPPLQPDPCDFLLDAIDAQLGLLQVKHSHPQKQESVFRFNQSLSKDTGLGSTVSHTNDAPVSGHDFQILPAAEPKADMTNYTAPAAASLQLDVSIRNNTEMESHKEEFMWRLERLLGDGCKGGATPGHPQPPTESICTEDFVRCFREEMIELPLPEKSGQEDEGERTLISDKDTFQSPQNNYISDASMNVKSSGKDPARVAFFQIRPEESEDKKCLSETSGVQTSQHGEKVFHSTSVENEHRNPKHISSPKPRFLAGVPVWNFDSVSIDSDLDSVCSDQVRRHFCRRAGTLSKAAQSKKQKAVHSKIDPFRVESLVNEDKDAIEESKGHWSRRSKLEEASEKMQSAWEKMNERLYTLRLRSEKEEETLRMKKSHLNEVELSLSELQLRRKHAFQDLERLGTETGHLETEKRQLEVLLNERKAERDSLKCQVQKLHRQKASYQCEVQNLEAEIKKKEQLEKTSGGEESRMGKFELDELAKQLACTKAELISEQQRAKEKQDSMQKMLEETCEKLLRVSEAETSLRKRSSHLEETQKLREKDFEILECEAHAVQEKLGACTVRVDALEKMLGQKEQQLRDLQEEHAVLRTEGDNLKRELEFNKRQNHTSLKEAREHAHTMMEAALRQQRNHLITVHEQQMQKLKKDEASALKNSLEHERDQSRKREEKLHVETLEKMCKAVDEERRKWEADKMEAVHFHCGLLEEQNKRNLESVRDEMHQERSHALSLQHKVAELHTRVQELEAERSAHQREQESLLSTISRSMKQEQQDELEKLKKHILEESEKSVQRAEGETERLRGVLQEQEIRRSEAKIEQEKQFGLWARELAAELEFLHILMQKDGSQRNTVKLPSCSTMGEALLQLKAQRVPFKNHIEHLHQGLQSQKQANEQLLKDKERELRIQRQQMRTERNQAVESLKERLIQEHVEELSSLKWSRMSDGGLEASLRKQLEAKDMELRQVQRSMTQWKEQTTARLACKFEDELTAELERCRAKLLRGRKASTNQDEKGTLKGQRTQELKHQHAQRSDLLTYVCASTPQSTSDVASLKLVHYLQSRVRQLRVENQSWTPPGPVLPALSNPEGEKP
ncbi:uncharacterized protein LOC144180904 [Stigmatopora nigra]